MMNDETIDILYALEKLDEIINSSDSSELEQDLAQALKQSLYYIRKNAEEIK